VSDDKNNEKLVGCLSCGFKEIRLLDKYCQKCGVFLCDKAKSGKTDLAKENQELKSQLAKVQKQLTEVLKKLRNSSVGQNNAELDQQIDYNEKLISHVEEVPEAEIKEQVQKSQALLENTTVNAAVSPSQNKEKNSGSLPYVIGGSVILISAGIISYFLLKKNKKSKID